MAQLLNESEVIKTWAPLIESSTGITQKDKLNWMSKYCHYHNINESTTNNVHLNPNMNINGMGAVYFPGDPGLSTAFSTQAPGSGDKPYSLLPLSMQVAAQTIGLDLVPVVPMSGPMGMLTYLDFVYAGGKTNNLENPITIMLKGYVESTALVADTTYFLRSTIGSASDWYKLVYLGKSFYSGDPIFKVIALDGSGANIALGGVARVSLAAAIAGTTPSLEDTAGGAGAQVDGGLGTAELVKALENHLPGFSGRGMRLGTATSNEPYLREEGESEPDNLMGLTLYNKSITAQTYQVGAAVTREQVQDLKQFGIDAVAQVESVLTNELTQSINKLILERIFRLGVTNHKKINTRDGSQFNILFNTSGSAATVVLGADNTGTSQSIASVPAIDADTLAGGETQGTLQRRVLDKILAAANVIAIRGRRGAGNFAVVNGYIATVLQTIAGFVAYPMANTISQQAGSLFPVGSIAGVNIYTDPNMEWTDTRVVVGRKGDGNSPGVVFMPYLLGDSVSTIAPETMAPKISLKSRFAIVEAGQYPENMYLTFKVQLTGVSII
jgi:hypothetical protein